MCLCLAPMDAPLTLCRLIFRVNWITSGSDFSQWGRRHALPCRNGSRNRRKSQSVIEETRCDSISLFFFPRGRKDVHRGPKCPQASASTLSRDAGFFCPSGGSSEQSLSNPAPRRPFTSQHPLNPLGGLLRGSFASLLFRWIPAPLKPARLPPLPAGQHPLPSRRPTRLPGATRRPRAAQTPR